MSELITPAQWEPLRELLMTTLWKSTVFEHLGCLSATAMQLTCGILHEIGKALNKTEVLQTQPPAALCSAIM